MWGVPIPTPRSIDRLFRSLDVELRAVIFNASGTCLPEDYVRRAADLAVHRLLKFLDALYPLTYMVARMIALHAGVHWS